MTETTYTLHISTTTLSGGVTVEAMVTADRVAGICGPFTASVRLDTNGERTPAELAAIALEELRIDREFTAPTEPRVRIGYDGLALAFVLAKLPSTYRA